MRTAGITVVILSFGFTSAVWGEELFVGLDRMPVEQALDLYQSQTGGTLIVSTNVIRVRKTVTIAPTEVKSEAESAKLIERALLEQASVVITELGNKRYSVTFNDALPAGGMTNILNFTPSPRKTFRSLPAEGQFPTLPRPSLPPLPERAKPVKTDPK